MLWTCAQVLCTGIYCKFDVIRFMWIELLQKNRATVIYPEFLRTPCGENCALDRKTIDIFQNELDVLYHHHAVFLGGGRSNNARRPLCCG